MSMLDRKLMRDLARLWAQALAVALVMACGVMTIVLAVGAARSLTETRSAFYDRYRFATVFASATRAPEALAQRIARLDGVAAVETRIVKPVILDMQGTREPASGIVVSLPDRGEAGVNRLYLRAGRLPEVARRDEAAVTESFAKAHRLSPGDGFRAVINGKRRDLTITGIVLSPEYVYAIGPGDMVPDQRRFGVMYMPRSTLAGLFDLDGAFNDVVATTERSAEIDRIVESIDRLLEPWGGAGSAHGRDEQTSHAFLDNELVQLAAMARVIPPVFLFIAAFLVNMILSRLIALEREQIGLLKAVGYSSTAIAWHYGKLVIAIALVGLAIGSAVGAWLGHGLTVLYGRFFSFPFLIFRSSTDLYVLAGLVTAGAALAGAAQAIAGAGRLPPAVAMRPAAPTRYGGVFGLSLLGRLFSQLATMALRHMLRWWRRTVLTAIGVSLSTALLVTALFSFDSIDAMIETIFFRADRQDATLTLAGEASPAAVHAISGLPGVLAAEPFRGTPAVLVSGHHEKRITVLAFDSGEDTLSRVLDPALDATELPESGIVLSERLAALMRLRPGDEAELELTARDGRIATVTVSGIAQAYVGLAAYMAPQALDRLMRDGPRISGARVLVDEARLSDLYAAIKATPSIAGVALQNLSRQKFRETIEENIAIMTTVYVALAVIITFGVIYNSARIQLSERARELASLRVLGFTRGEVGKVLMIELALIVFAAQPLGWAVGCGFSMLVVEGFASDLFTIPLVINASTFALSSLVVLAAALVAALIVRRRVDNLDLIRVLKTRE